MNGVAVWPADERRDLFQLTATERGLTLQLAEKDFWVCWTLWHLFTLNLRAELVFKGGTSLSKVYGIIDRFSEDIDLSVNRDMLGFAQRAESFRTLSRNAKKALADQITAECEQFVQSEVMPSLEARFRSILGPDDWRLTRDLLDRDHSTVIFEYPTTLTAEEKVQYHAASVRIEIGARAEHWPSQPATIAPYAAQYFPDVFDVGECTIQALEVRRTLWEKSMILHREHFRESGKPTERHSRHYYDIYQIDRSRLCAEEISNPTLLEAVRDHTEAFYTRTGARYELATPSGLRLVPHENHRSILERDYQQTRDMIYGDVPKIEEIIEQLADIERRLRGAE